ncbi:hypothetical protein [Paenibacillus taichungensis]|uniref:hypothetical protein n=1 Tax=Paenibacillus taichungensis TaxID=484184 RepID=UPI0039A126D9
MREKVTSYINNSTLGDTKHVVILLSLTLFEKINESNDHDEEIVDICYLLKDQVLECDSELSFGERQVIYTISLLIIYHYSTLTEDYHLPDHRGMCCYSELLLCTLIDGLDDRMINRIDAYLNLDASCYKYNVEYAANELQTHLCPVFIKSHFDEELFETYNFAICNYKEFSEHSLQIIATGLENYKLNEIRTFGKEIISYNSIVSSISGTIEFELRELLKTLGHRIDSFNSAINKLSELTERDDYVSYLATLCDKFHIIRRYRNISSHGKEKINKEQMDEIYDILFEQNLFGQLSAALHDARYK